MDELVDALRNCADYSDCGICKLNGKSNCADIMMRDAADAIERLTAEIDCKDKAIERLRDLMKHYKAAYRTAYKLYQEARNEQQP